jgi:hypothetical protein
VKKELIERVVNLLESITFDGAVITDRMSEEAQYLIDELEEKAQYFTDELEDGE